MVYPHHQDGYLRVGPSFGSGARVRVTTCKPPGAGSVSARGLGAGLRAWRGIVHSGRLAGFWD